MTDCDILMYLFASFSVAGCGLVFIAARVRQRYIDEINLLKAEIECEERRFNQLWDQFAALDKSNQELVEVLELLRKEAGDDGDLSSWFIKEVVDDVLAKARGTE